MDWNATNVTESDLALNSGEISAYPGYPANGVNTTAKLQTAVIGYIQGKDGFDQDGDLNFTEMRPAVLGDIFRSNVLFVGSPTTQLAAEPGYADFLTDYGHRDRVVYAGANDALLHGFAAGAWWNPADASAFNSGTGAELFGYVPGALLPVAKLTARDIDAQGNRLVPGFLDGALVAADAWLGDGTGTDVTKSSRRKGLPRARHHAARRHERRALALSEAALGVLRRETRSDLVAPGDHAREGARRLGLGRPLRRR
ncbi:MAG: hypothetical protein E6J87_25645 [Deltaproteobacteria bacterium]|nr:MAG: hypothetical protein E6J87_25645 [Deltaproteobacteria bacterium]